MNSIQVKDFNGFSNSKYPSLKQLQTINLIFNTKIINFFICPILRIASLFCLFRNTVSVNFWFDPKNESEGQTGQEEVDTSSYYSGVKENDDNQPQRTTVEQTNDNHITVEANEKLETQAEQPVNDETSGGVSETFVENGMEEEREIDLTASGYLALVREIEVALFKATFSHKKVHLS